jgi:hypothetical protein
MQAEVRDNKPTKQYLEGLGFRAVAGNDAPFLGIWIRKYSKLLPRYFDVVLVANGPLQTEDGLHALQETAARNAAKAVGKGRGICAAFLFADWIGADRPALLRPPRFGKAKVVTALRAGSELVLPTTSDWLQSLRSDYAFAEALWLGEREPSRMNPAELGRLALISIMAALGIGLVLGIQFCWMMGRR